MIVANSSRSRIPHKVFRSIDECSAELPNLPYSNLCIVNSIAELDDKLRQLGALLIDTSNADELTFEAVLITRVNNATELQMLLNIFSSRFTLWTIFSGSGIEYHETLSVLEDRCQ